jgi:hypothetical protein
MVVEYTFFTISIISHPKKTCGRAMSGSMEATGNIFTRNHHVLSPWKILYGVAQSIDTTGQEYGGFRGKFTIQKPLVSYV